MIDGNLHALRQYENDIANQDAYEEYLEKKTELVTLDLLCGATLNIKGDMYNIESFTCDAEISDECMINLLRDDTSNIKSLFNDYCENVAKLLIENEEEPRDDY